MIEIEGDCSSDADSREEGVCAAIVTGGNAAPVFQAPEHVLDPVPLAIERLVVCDWRFAASGRWNAGLDALSDQGGSEPVAVIAPVGDQACGLWESIEDKACALVIAHLAFAQEQDDRLALIVANSVELGVQAAFRAPDKTGNIPFLSRLAAVR